MRKHFVHTFFFYAFFPFVTYSFKCKYIFETVPTVSFLLSATFRKQNKKSLTGNHINKPAGSFIGANQWSALITSFVSSLYHFRQ